MRSAIRIATVTAKGLAVVGLLLLAVSLQDARLGDAVSGDIIIDDLGSGFSKFGQFGQSSSGGYNGHYYPG